MASHKGQVTRQGWATSKSPGKRTQLLAIPPFSGEGTGSLRLPHLHISNGDFTSQREALMTWGGGLCDSGPGRGFRLFLSTLSTLGRWGPVLSTHSTHGGAHRGQGCWELSGCSVLIRGDHQGLHSLLLVSLRGRDTPQFSNDSPWNCPGQNTGVSG